MNTDRFKFRAWDTEKKAWKGLWIFRGGHSEEYDVSNTEIDILNLEGRWGSNVILMQCTGLKDIEGNLIYEGDILQGFTKNDSIEFKEEVRFSPVLGYYISNEDIDDDRILYDNYVRFSDCKIIGNIYETV